MLLVAFSLNIKISYFRSLISLIKVYEFELSMYLSYLYWELSLRTSISTSCCNLIISWTYCSVSFLIHICINLFNFLFLMFYLFLLLFAVAVVLRILGLNSVDIKIVFFVVYGWWDTLNCCLLTTLGFLSLKIVLILVCNFLIVIFIDKFIIFLLI